VIEAARRVENGSVTAEDSVRDQGVAELSPFWGLRPLYLRHGIECDIWRLSLIDGMHCWSQLIPRLLFMLMGEIEREDYLQVRFTVPVDVFIVVSLFLYYLFFPQTVITSAIRDEIDRRLRTTIHPEGATYSKPPPLSQLSSWSALHTIHFGYIAPIILNGLVPEDVQNLVDLLSAVLQRQFAPVDIAQAANSHRLTCRFLQQAESVLGPKYMTIYTHLLAHVDQQNITLGPMSIIWTAGAERQNGLIKAIGNNGHDLSLQWCRGVRLCVFLCFVFFFSTVGDEVFF
jgi:hypothetical protein